MRENQRVGSIRVNIVSADLQSRGYEVCREDGLCSFDLVAHKNGNLLRVEVKGHSKTRFPRGNIVGTTGVSCTLDCRKFDVLASVEELEQRFRVRYLHSQSTLSARNHFIAAYELAGSPEHSIHTTKKNLNRAENFKENNGHQDQNDPSRQSEGQSLQKQKTQPD